MRQEDLAVIGADLGTGSMKALLVSPDGTVLAETGQEYPMRRPRPGWNENDPDDWARAFTGCVGRLARDARERGVRVPAVCLVAQRDPFVLLDPSGRPATASISWTDQRSRPQTEHVRKAVGWERLIEIGGARPITGLGLGNLLWTRANLPDAWASTARVTSPKDYVLNAVAGVRGTDLTTPTRSMAYDCAGHRWSSEILGAVGLSEDLFDEIRYAPWEPCTSIDPGWAVSLGLGPGVVLAAGGSDDEASALGAGAVAPGQVCLGTGTCSEWLAVIPGYAPDLSGHGDTAPHVLPGGRFVREVTIDSAGSSLRWFRNELCRGMGYDEIVELAMKAPPGSGGVQFFPFIAGAERAPYYQEDASGVFFGITSHHSRAHLARAILEGVAFLYPRTRELLAAPPSSEPLTMVDGEASSPQWTQLKADVLGEPIRVTEVLSASALGAAILAAVSAGLYGDVEEAAAAMVRYGPVTWPRADYHERYAGLRADFEETFEQLRRCFRPRGPQDLA
jgi:sugar (pentulose or hexulose) kinase